MYIYHPKKSNHVHKYQNGLLYDIITLGTNVSGDNTVFNNGIRVYNLGQRAHALKHLHRRYIVGPFEKLFHGDTLRIGNRAVISFIFHKSIFLHFHCKGDVFYNRYINKEDKKLYIL